MKCSTYKVIKHIPFAKIILSLTGNNEYMLCSQILADKTFEPILAYKRNHPNEVITYKLAKKIMKSK